MRNMVRIWTTIAVLILSIVTLSTILSSASNAYAASFFGTDKSDVLVGTASDDQIRALAGDDKLFGGDGEDYLQGGSGNDLLVGGVATDYIEGGDGQDLIYGQDGGDIIYGNAGQDTIYAGAGNDYIGTDDNDFVDCGSGFDYVPIKYPHTTYVNCEIFGSKSSGY
jgi:Ca2+-binding RTX toxin-like protein